MKEVRSSSNPVTVAMWQSILQDAGIRHFVKNDMTQNMLVGTDFWAELWVFEDDDYPEAKKLLEEPQKEPLTTSIEWTCPACGEKVPGNFTSCWQCQTERDAKLV